MAMLVRHVCGNLKSLSVTATSALAGGCPVAASLYASGFGLNGKARGVGRLDEAGQHAGVADLVRDPDVGGLAGEDARAAADLRGLIAVDVPVEADTRRPQRRRLRQRPGVVVHGVAALIPERERVDERVVEARVAEVGDVHANAGRHGQVALRPPLVLRVAADVPDVERLEGRARRARHVRVAHLELVQHHRRRRPVRVGEVAVQVRVEVVERVVDVGALDARIERVV